MLTVVANALEEILYAAVDFDMKSDILREKKNTKHNIHRHKRCITNTQKLSFSAMMCALGVVILFMGAIIELVDITMAAMASFLIVICMIELGGYMPWLVYFVTSALAFLLLPNKTVVLIYALFFGFYPILKNYFERTRPFFSWIAKFALFNVIIAFYYLVSKELFLFNADSVKGYLFVMMNVIFFTFDLTLTLFVTAYVRRLRRLLRIHKFFK